MIGGSFSLSCFQAYETTLYNCCQVTVSDSINFSTNLDENEQIIEQAKKHIPANMKMFVHGKFVYNFCKPDESHLQKVALADELYLANQLKADVVIHMGPKGDNEALSIHHFVQNLSTMFDKYVVEEDHKNRVLLENSASKNSVGRKLETMAIIYQRLCQSMLGDRIGICLDLCHMFASGDCDLRSAKSTSEMLARYQKLMPLDSLKLIHFNDSATPFSSGVDRHADIFCGFITNPLLGGSLEGLTVLVEFAKKHQIPMIFETPTYIRRQVARQWMLDSTSITSETIKKFNQAGFEIYKKKIRS